MHLWRCAGQYANLGVFGVTYDDRLKELSRGPPLFPSLNVTVTAPAARHSSAAPPHHLASVSP